MIGDTSLGKRMRTTSCRRARFGNVANRTLVLGAILVCGLLAAEPAQACDASKHLAAQRKPAHHRAPLAIGDSVMLGAADALARAGIEVDARGCRQIAAGLSVMRQRRRAGTLPPVVIVALGANWIVTRGDIRRALAIVGERRLLVLVTPRESGGGSGSDAVVMRKAGRRHPRRIAVADWVRFSAGHGDWFAGDGLHLSAAGIAGMRRLLAPYRRATPPQPVPCPG